MFLFWYEHDYISREVTNKNTAIHSLEFASHYIDDLNVPNISQNIINIIFNDIYSKELDIEKTSIKNDSSTFLDIY